MKSIKGSTIKSTRKDFRTHFEKAEVLEIVRKKEAGVSDRILCRDHGMSNASILRWMHEYGSSEYIAGIKIMHTSQQIRPIVRAIQEGRLTERDAAVKCNVSLKTVKRWVKNFQQEEADLSVPKPDIMPTPAPPPDDTGLLQELEAAKLKIKALETMIEVAEAQFNIPIRKKFGAKQ